MKRLALHHETPERRKLDQAVAVLHDGGVVAYPTDTLYALGCAIESRRGIERIYQVKRMDPKQRLAVMCPDLSTAARYALMSDVAHRIVRKLVPGPYTIVLPATRDVPRMLLDKRTRKVGVRVPDHPVTSALVLALGRPLLTSSAVDPDTGEPCTEADEVEARFGRAIDLLLDGGPTGTQPSTVLEITDGVVTVLREGAGPIDAVV